MQDVLDLPTQQTSIYLAADAVKKAKRLAKLDETTYATIALDAIDAALQNDVLPDLVRSRQVVERPEGSRFPARRFLRSRAGSGNRILWPLQLTEEERTVIDDLAGELGAAYRSTVVAAAVEWYMGTPRVRRRLDQSTT